MCPVIQIGPVTVTGYWLMAVLGLVFSIAYVAAANRCGRFAPVEGRHIFNLCCIAILSIFAGGKLMAVLVNLPGIVQNWGIYKNAPGALLAGLTKGRAFYGGALLLVALFAWYIRKNRLPVNTLCAVYTPATALFMVFGRLGCFMGGCCYGVPVPWGVVFPENSIAPGGVPLFPSQLAEAACQFALFLALVAAERRLQKKWPLVSLYLGGYAVIRFVLEFWRGDAVRGVWILSSSQWVSLALLGIVGLHYAVARKKKRAVS